MKRMLTLSFLAAAVLSAAILTPGASVAEGDPSEPATRKLIEEIQAQQKQLGENQTRIESILASAAEEVRVARIYVSRNR